MGADVKSAAGQRGRPWHRGLTRAAVSEAALALLDREGRRALTMRRLAAELDVAPPSLYEHVAGKSELIDLVVERVLAGVTLPPVAQGTVDELVAGFTEYRRALLAHPEAAQLLVEQPRLSPVSVALVERSLGVLIGLGLSLHEAVDRHVTAVAYLLGWICQELVPSKVSPGVTLDAPLAKAGIQYLLGSDTDERFEKGLRFILEG